MKRLILMLGLAATSATAAPRMTAFTAQKGFQFANTFANDFVPQLDVRTGGLCGGMSWSALDYFYRGVATPNQDWRPANGTTLQKYLYDRQVGSIMANLDKWAEVGFNPGGVRNTEFFNWGLQAGTGGRITELRALIDAGKPAVLGLHAADGNTGNHQVVAVGYDLGRYKGDLGAYKSDFKIFLYDPNYPGKLVTLVPELDKQSYTILEETDAAVKPHWRTYFVDRNYQAKVPPSLPHPAWPNDGTMRSLLLHFYTGNDDLRGGNDDVNVTVYPKAGPAQVFTNVNLGSRWLSNYDETVELKLKTPVDIGGLDGILVTTTFAGGVGGDNWDMAKLRIRGLGGGYNQLLKQTGFKRFTGSDKTFHVDLTAAQPSQVELIIKTGADDLRGGTDNLDATVFFRDGTSKVFHNVNGSGKYDPNSWARETLPLAKAIQPEDVVKVQLATTFSGGVGGDNWDMQSVEIRVIGQDTDVKIGGAGFKRFTAASKTLTLATAPVD
jgi:hypothetical protein